MDGDPRRMDRAPQSEIDEVLTTGDPRIDRRRRLAYQVLLALRDSGGDPMSFRSLAAEVGVARPTLRHHFGDETGALRAALEIASELGTIYTARVADAEGAPAMLLPIMLSAYAGAWTTGGLAALHKVGMTAGFRDGALGKVYAEKLLSQTIAAFATLLRRWDEAGALRVPDPDVAALSLLAPIHVLLIVRHNLGSGSGLGGVSEDAVIRQRVEEFLAFHQPG